MGFFLFDLIAALFGKKKRPPKPPTPVPVPPPDPMPVPGPTGSGLLLPCTDTLVRPGIPSGWPVPRDVGMFQFPAPYHSAGWRLTAPGEQVRYAGYSYWRTTNRHVNSPKMLAFVSLVGVGPVLISIDKGSGAVERLGPIFDRDLTGEQMYFSDVHSDLLYYAEGSQLRRRDVLTSAEEVVFDHQRYMSGTVIDQCHSTSALVHCGTVKDASTWLKIGVFVYNEPAKDWRFYEAQGLLDECQLDKTGRWLVVKEGDDNRIIDTQSGDEEYVVLNRDGAVGHSDTGKGYMLGEDDYNEQPGAVVAWDLGVVRPVWQRERMYHTMDWASGMGHLSHCCAVMDSGIAWLSNASMHPTPRANEVLWFPVTTMQAIQPVCTVVAPNLVDPGRVNWADPEDRYRHSPKGNCDITGSYFMWTANAGEDQLSAWLVRR